MSIEVLQTQLQLRADPKTKAWWEGYLKHTIAFRGVKMADIRAALHEWIRHEGIGLLPTEQQKGLALDLIRLGYCEDKLAGILFLQEILLPADAIDWRADLPRFGDLFEQAHIYEWNTCDWFCVRVLGRLAEREGIECAHAISGWRSARTLWQRRAAAVAFVNLARRGETNFPGFTDMLLATCAPLVASQERFAQTGAGWVLRELSLADPERVAGFVEDHVREFSREGLSYSTEKLPAESKVRLKALHSARETFPEDTHKPGKQ
jgi:3-methyladenine DNA glycosylase AlkD